MVATFCEMQLELLGVEHADERGKVVAQRRHVDQQRRVLWASSGPRAGLAALTAAALTAAACRPVHVMLARSKAFDDNNATGSQRSRARTVQAQS